MMISVLHPVNLPMKKHLTAMLTEKQVSIFWLDSTCALSDHLASRKKNTEKGFLTFASLTVSTFTCVSILYLTANSYKTSLPLQNWTEIRHWPQML